MKVKLNDWKWQVSKGKEYQVFKDEYGELYILDDIDYLYYIDVERDFSNCLISEVIEE